jgi:uncharacterized protein (TIGR00297 family)
VQLPIGILLGILIALLAWRAGALSGSGAWAAAVTGGLIFGLGGLPWAALLMAFFVSSSVLSRLFGKQKSALAEKFSKGHRRDWGQVLANGGLGALLAVVHGLFPSASWTWAAFAGAMAAVNADTWATELGVLSKKAPRLVTTLQPVERGSSGGVTLLGTMAALGGAAFVALIALLSNWRESEWELLAAAVLGGVAGSYFDSLLGATVQAIYHCPTCNKETERHPIHTCGIATTQVRGWRWMDNDVVNWFCSLMGALVTVLLWKLLAGL